MARPFILKSPEGPSLHLPLPRDDGANKCGGSGARDAIRTVFAFFTVKSARQARGSECVVLLPPAFQAIVLPNILNCIREEPGVFCRILLASCVPVSTSCTARSFSGLD